MSRVYLIKYYTLYYTDSAHSLRYVLNDNETLSQKPQGRQLHCKMSPFLFSSCQKQYLHRLMNVKKHILPIIIFSQFCCTSLWFAGNGIIGDLISAYNLPTESLSSLTSAVQFGFIVGTLTFAFLTIADRFSPSKVFLLSALFGAVFNLEMMLSANTLTSLLIFRFLTGFALAGIYPVGMKIASDYYQKGLGTSLGYLVGALVLGTAFPHLLKSIPDLFYWKIHCH